jgi:hypothetical protein
MIEGRGSKILEQSKIQNPKSKIIFAEGKKYYG